MSTITHIKKDLANSIFDLFRFRKETFKEGSWYCVLRGEQLLVIRPYAKGSRDNIIINSYLKPGQSPSKILIYLALRENWHLFSKLSTESLSKLLMAPRPRKVNISTILRMRQNYILTQRLFLRQFKDFFVNNLKWMRI